MPLYIKLDFGKNGEIHAWVTREYINWPSGSLSETHAATPKTCLRLLATKLGNLDNKSMEPKP